MFDRYCLPSVRSQTNDDFTWLLFVHRDTPNSCRDRLQRAGEVVAIDTMEPEVVRRAVAERLAPDADLVLTQRLDSDDAIARDFVARLQTSAPGRARFLNFEHGYQFDARQGRLYRRREISNPFIAYVEPASDEPLTVHQGFHNKLAGLGPIEQLPRRTWLQVLHGANQLNELRGVRCSTSELAAFDVRPERVAGDDLAMRMETVSSAVKVTARRVVGRLRRF